MRQAWVYAGTGLALIAAGSFTLALARSSLAEFAAGLVLGMGGITLAAGVAVLVVRRLGGPRDDA